MAVNLDKLKKLVELASNNPDENEANSAARKVCKMLKEDGFKCFTPSSNGPSFNRQESPWSNFDDILENMRRASWTRQYTRTNQYRPQPEDDGPFNWGYDTREGKKEKKSEERECSKCGVKIKTFRVKEQPFICGICKWNYWEKEKA